MSGPIVHNRSFSSDTEDTSRSVPEEESIRKREYVNNHESSMAFITEIPLKNFPLKSDEQFAYVYSSRVFLKIYNQCLILPL